MSLSSKVKGNGRETMPKKISPKDLEFINAKELAGVEIDPLPLLGYFFTKGRYGRRVSLVVEKDGKPLGVNIPNWYVKTFEELTDEEVQEIFDSKQALAGIDPFETSGGNTSYRINIIDIDPDELPFS